jgi:hypothetical protein
MDQELKSLIAKIVRFAIIMIIIGLVIGIFYREYSKKLLYKFPLDTQVLVGHHFSLAHGHTILLGAVIPLLLALLAFLVYECYEKKSEMFRLLRKVFNFYMIGAIASLILLYYKGSAFIYIFQKNPAQSLNVIDKNLFFGIDLLRIFLYLICHAIWGVSLIYFVGVLFPKFKKG